MPTDSLTINKIREAFFSLKINESPEYDEKRFNAIKNCFSELKCHLNTCLKCLYKVESSR